METETSAAPKRNNVILKWGTLKGWDVHTPAAMDALKRYHEDPVSWGTMSQRDTPKQQQAILDLIDQCDDIWLDWENKQVTREEAKEYIRNYRKD